MRVVTVSLIALATLVAAQQASAQTRHVRADRDTGFTRTYSAPAADLIPALYLYREAGLNGQVARIERTQPNLPAVEAASLITTTESTWEICDGRGFTGRCAVVGGQVNDVPGVTGINQIRSIRPAR